MEGDRQEISRRKVLSAAGLAAVAVPLAATGRARAASLVRRADSTGAPGPEGVHVQYGHDASSQAVVSWQTDAPVFRPRLRNEKTDGLSALSARYVRRDFHDYQGPAPIRAGLYLQSDPSIQPLFICGR